MKNRTIWRVNSRHAVVTCVTNGSQGCIVRKQISPKDINAGNAVWVNNTSRYFRNRLRELKVPLAEPYECFEAGNKAIQTSPYIGIDLEQIVHRGVPQVDLLEIVLESMQGVLTQKIPEVGIDARLSNFCLGTNGKAIYVDTFPPLVKYEGQYIVHFPNPTDPAILKQEMMRKFDPLGILRRLRFSILEQDVGYTERNFLDAISNVLGITFSWKAEEFFNTFLDHIDTYIAFEKMTLDDPDGIREFALKFMPQKGQGRTKFFSEIFDLSSNFCPLDISDEERMSRIKSLISKQTAAS